MPEQVKLGPVGGAPGVLNYPDLLFSGATALGRWEVQPSSQIDMKCSELAEAVRICLSTHSEQAFQTFRKNLRKVGVHFQG